MLLLNLLAQRQIPLGSFEPPSKFYVPGTSVCTTGTALENILSISIGVLTVIAGLAFLLFFLFGALQWVSAGGESGRVDSAKKQMTNGAIGLIIIVMSYGVISVIGRVVGVDILNPAQILTQIGPAKANCLPATSPIQPGPISPGDIEI